MKKASLLTLLSLCILIPATLYLGTKLPGRAYYFTGTLIILEIMLPFFAGFEGRKPQARELVLIAVMCALAVASRTAFIWLPQFKPIFAVIILSAVAFGPHAGFLVGSISAFVSNFIFGQGPWTPWQMLACGVCGLLAGIVYKRRWVSTKPLELAFFGIFSTMLVVGPLLDTGTVFTTLTVFTPTALITIYTAGIFMNFIQGVCTFLTLLLLTRPMLDKLQRVKVKYGILPEQT